VAEFWHTEAVRLDREHMEEIMSSISDVQALVVQQGTLITALVAEVAALRAAAGGSPSTTVLSTADQASVDSMDEVLAAQIAQLTAAEPAPAPAPAAAPAGAASFMEGEPVSNEPEEEESASEAPAESEPEAEPVADESQTPEAAPEASEGEESSEPVAEPAV
jgi:pilus assembly protein FimV